MNVLIFGFGQIGCSFEAALYFSSRGHSVKVYNYHIDPHKEASKTELQEILEKKGIEFCNQETFQDAINWSNIIVKSCTTVCDDYDVPSNKKIITDLSYLFSAPLMKDVKIICISGARSKTTTASALCHALNTFGISAHMCGNMGISGFCELERLENGDIPQYLICELSYGQIRDTIGIMGYQLPFIEISVFTGIGSSTHFLDSFTPILTASSSSIICPENCKKVVYR